MVHKYAVLVYNYAMYMKVDSSVKAALESLEGVVLELCQSDMEA